MFTLIVRQRVSIKRPIYEVFSLVAEHYFENRGKWTDNLLESEKVTEGKMGLGTIGRALSEDRWGRRIEQIYEVTTFDPPHELAFRGISRFAQEQPKRQVSPENQ